MAVRPGRGASGTLRQELFLVAIPDKVEAVRAVQACLPDAEVKIDSEASPDIFAEISGQRRRDVRTPGGIMILCAHAVSPRAR